MSEKNAAAETTVTAGANGNANGAAASAEAAAAAASKETPVVAHSKPGAEGKVVDKPVDKVDIAAPAVPEKYELKARKDSKFSEADLTEVAAEAKALGLTQEQAQKMLESKEVGFDKYAERQQQAARDQQANWRKEVEVDKEIAGSDGKMYKQNIEVAHRALDRFADENFKKVLNETGLGNNPHLIRTFLRIGKGMAEDRAIVDGKTAAPTKQRTREEKLFPSHFKEKKEG